MCRENKEAFEERRKKKWGVHVCSSKQVGDSTYRKAEQKLAMPGGMWGNTLPQPASLLLHTTTERVCKTSEKNEGRRVVYISGKRATVVRCRG